MNIKIEINTDGKAFKVDKCGEVANILSQLVSVYRQTYDIQPTGMAIRASNGNRCGTVTITESERNDTLQEFKDSYIVNTESEE